MQCVSVCVCSNRNNDDYINNNRTSAVLKDHHFSVPVSNYLHLLDILSLEGELWFALTASILCWSTILWVLQRAWCWVAGTQMARAEVLQFSTSLLYGWGALLEQAISEPPVSHAGRVRISSCFSSLSRNSFCVIV